MDAYTITLDEELLIKELPDIKDWSENYAFIGYDFESNIGFCAYIGRWTKNPTVLREQLYLYLPDGSLLTHIGFGKVLSREVVRAACLEFRCDKAGGRWDISFEGPMRLDALDQLLVEPIHQGAPKEVKFEVSIEPKSPVWMFPKANNKSFGNFHYEQSGKGQGTIKFNRQKMDFSASCHRDHSRGPRNLGNFDGHLWLQLHFSNGTTFAGYQTWVKSEGKLERILNNGALLSSDALSEAVLLNEPRFPSLNNLLDPVSVQISMDGQERKLLGKPVATLAYSFATDVEFRYGLVPSLVDFYSIEQPILFDLDGEVIEGYLQRSGPFRK